ncbi:hypothetical protein KIL84_006335 [Mauremys mutica]|uniref:Uncharacterized protein n=1 Tax=Mauremys mutica TaxID=74926 RepID=A0A9D3X0Y0_9SAUR|nr:hypothetical protein KIL84_006335 [Mauremys mutica]
MKEEQYFSQENPKDRTQRKNRDRLMNLNTYALPFSFDSPSKPRKCLVIFRKMFTPKMENDSLLSRRVCHHSLHSALRWEGKETNKKCQRNCLSKCCFFQARRIIDETFLVHNIRETGIRCLVMNPLNSETLKPK